MPSSTSSSRAGGSAPGPSPARPPGAAGGARRRGEWRRYGAYASATAVTALVLAAIAAAVWRMPPLSARTMEVAEARPRLSRFDYLAHDDRSGHIDHYVHYHGLAGVPDNARAADVLFLGNSRLMFAMPTRIVRAFFTTRELRHYVMGFGHVEANVFAEAVMARLDLRPSVVVVNADGSFFTGGTSDWAQVVMDSSRFDAVKYRFEARVAHGVRRVVHRFVPHAVELIEDEPEIVIYRSSLDGTWTVEWARYVDLGVRVPPDPGRPASLDEQTLSIARRFQAIVTERGARLVLLSVPSPRVVPGHARALAEALGVPLLAPAVDDMRHFDTSHLIPSSARRYAEAMLAELDGQLEWNRPDASP